MNDGPGVRIRDHSDELQFFTAEAAGIGGLILDVSNLFSPKYLHGGPGPPKGNNGQLRELWFRVQRQ
jgi:hypothetical protein